MCMKCLKLIGFNQDNEEVKGEPSINLNVRRDEPQRFYEQHEVELLHK